VKRRPEALRGAAPRGGGADAGPVLDVDGVSLWLSGRKVLDDVSFSLAPGEFAGLIGSNGAGKTTLLRVILGLQAPSAGTVRVAGQPRTRRGSLIGYVPQKILLDPDMPLRARDLVGLGLDGQRLGIPLPSARRRHQVDEMLQAVGAARFADTRVGLLSGGEQQRVLIAHALISRPRLLLLDEPLANLDIASEQDVVELLGQVARQQQVAVLISAHDMNPLLPVTTSRRRSCSTRTCRCAPGTWSAWDWTGSGWASRCRRPGAGTRSTRCCRPWTRRGSLTREWACCPAASSSGCSSRTR